MSMQMSGQGFVSKAEKTEIVAYSIKTNANQHINPSFKPQNGVSGFNFEISIAKA